MATYIKRGDRWHAQVRIKGQSRFASFRTKTECQAWAAVVETEIRNGIKPAQQQTLFREVLERYANEISKTKRGQRWELIRIKKFQSLPFYNLFISDITTPMISAWRDDSLKLIKPSSFNRELNLLSAILETARREWQLITTNPARDVRRPKNPKHRERIFSRSEIESITHTLGINQGIETTITTGSQIIGMAFLFSIETGMRRGEIESLTWDNVHLDRHCVTLELTKNGDSREVPLSPTASAILKNLTEFKKPFDIDKDVLSTMFRKTCLKIGISNAHFHDARATAITRLSKKLDVLELARMIGHRDIKSLMIYYRESAETIAKKLI